MKELIEAIKLKYLEDGIKLYPPASLSEIAAAETKLGCALPPDLKEFYSICNGFECAEDKFNILGAKSLFRDNDYGYGGIVFAEYNIFYDAWAMRILRDDGYEIIYDDGNGLIILTNSLGTFLEKLLQGHLFKPGGLYEWHKEFVRQ